MTERLFDNDAYLWAFDAQVLSCVPRNEYFDVILDRTAFFPEGGGQPADQGTIDQARVLDVHESDGTIHHYTDRPVACGPVHCQLDAARRMDHMQQHSGEHIFSGLVFQHYGFHNVGFHMGTDAITMDFDGTLTREQAAQIESEVNEAIWKNLPVTVFYPSEHEEQNISYRAKKEIDGQLRLVCIEGYDLCACCGTHVSRTGEIGQVKIIGMIHYKRGVRISILCGRRALVYESHMLHDYHQAAHLLSAQEGSLGQSTQRLIQERDDLLHRMSALGLQIFRMLAQSESGDVRLVSCDSLDGHQLRPCASELANTCQLGMVIVPSANGCRFALSSRTMDVRPIAQLLKNRFGGNGGGTADMVQGILTAVDEETLRQTLQTCLPNAV